MTEKNIKKLTKLSDLLSWWLTSNDQPDLKISKTTTLDELIAILDHEKTKAKISNDLDDWKNLKAALVNAGYDLSKYNIEVEQPKEEIVEEPKKERKVDIFDLCNISK